MLGCEKSVDDLLQEATVLENQGRYTEAIEILNRAIQKDSTFLGAYINRGVNQAALGRDTLAIADYKKVLEFDKDNTLANFNIGNSLKRMKDPEAALKYYNRAFGFDENGKLSTRIVFYHDPDPYGVPMDEILFQRGLTYYELGRFGFAFDDFAQISNGNETPEVQYMIGISALNLGDNQIGCNALRSAIRLGHPEAKSTYNTYCK